jgi:hypothetical protein
MEALVSFVFDILFLTFLRKRRKFRIWLISIMVAAIVLPWVVRTILEDPKPNRITSRRGKELLFEIESFKEANNTFPSNLEAVLRNNPLKRDWKIDGWGRNFYYRQTKDSFVLYSSGKDRIEGTNDDMYFSK